MSAVDERMPAIAAPLLPQAVTTVATGSRSAGHRGYRPAEAESGAPKQRWGASERAGRDEARGIRKPRGVRAS